MAIYLSGKTANEVWKKAMQEIQKQDNLVAGRGGNVYEILHTFFTIENPQQKWVISRVPPISIAFALAELIWILNGDNRADVINFWNPSLKKFAGLDKTYYGAYGERLRKHFGLDQLNAAYEALSYLPESRQVVLQMYDVKSDLPIDEGKPRSKDIPCNVCSMLKVRNRCLEWSQIMRSNDIILGMPYNFVQFTSIQEVMAGWLGLEVGSYNHYSDSLHLYERDINKALISETDLPSNTDSLSIPKEDSERVVGEIYMRMKKIVEEDVSESQLSILSKLESKYKAYNNIMFVITAYAAKKKFDMNFANDIMLECSNSLYVNLWERWTKRSLTKGNN